VPKSEYDVQLDRHEAKYIIPRSLVPDIRDFIRPFCEPDPHAQGDPPEYVVTTLQLDSPALSLYRSVEWEALNRFKLRVRTYGTPGGSPVFLEIKQKQRGTILKSRAVVPWEAWGEDLVRGRCQDLRFRSREEEACYLNFVRLVQELGAEPVLLVRYTRESYRGRVDSYARVTMDRKLLYQPVRGWTDWGAPDGWRVMDTPLAQNRWHPFSGVVLELKMLSFAPSWMLDMIRKFNLVRTGNCKYATGVGQEALFRGVPDMPSFAIELFS